MAGGEVQQGELVLGRHAPGRLEHGPEAPVPGVVGRLGVTVPQGGKLGEEGVEVDIRRLGRPTPRYRCHVRLTTYEPGIDKGVRGIDSVRGIGGSEPTLPKRREKVGTTNNCQL